MRVFKSIYGCAGVLSVVLAAGVPASAQDVPDVGPKPPVVVKPMESHIGNVAGHAASGKSNYRRYCAGCHGDYGDSNGENAVWLDPRPRDFTIATFKCRSTPTGTLPTDEDLFNTVGRGVTNSNMPIWNALSPQQRADLVAYIKIFSPRWEKEKAGEPIKIPAEPPVTLESISHGKALFTKLECWKCHGPHGEGDGPSAATLTDSKDLPIRPYNFAAGSCVHCRSTVTARKTKFCRLRTELFPRTWIKTRRQQPPLRPIISCPAAQTSHGHLVIDTSHRRGEKFDESSLQKICGNGLYAADSWVWSVVLDA